MLRIDQVERAVDHRDLPGPHEVGLALELIHAHPPGVRGFVSIGSKLGHTLVGHHLGVEGEQQHGVGVRRHLVHVLPVARFGAHTNLLPHLGSSRLGARVAGFYEPSYERFAPETWLDAARLHDHVPSPFLGVVPEHEAHRDRVGGYPALPLAVPEPEEPALGTAERHALAAPGVDEACLERVHHASGALRAELRHYIGREANRRRGHF